ncbi:MAG: hypothetical protein H7210_12435 [Pyrinomonadaceae bacterium]|nr:hypothetical protein [Phycisphaerales bacterium]
MSNVSVRRFVAPGLSVIGILLATGQVCGQTVTRWFDDQSGDWSDLARWDNGVPTGNFNAFIDATGLAYTVNMNGNFSIVDFTMDVAEATLDLGNNTLTLSGNYLQQSAVLRGNAAGTGTVRTGIGQTTTLRDTMLMRVQTFNSRGILNIDGGSLLDVCDTGIDHSGTGCSWTGLGDIALEGTSSMTFGPTSTFNILNSQSITSGNLPGNLPVITNNGSIIVNAAVPGVSTLSNVRINNLGTAQNPGIVDVRGGNTFMTPDVVNFAAGTLTGGQWKVGGASVLNFGTQNVATNRADIVLSNGVASAQFPNLQGALTLNDTLGKLTLENSESFTTVGNFTNMGLIKVDGTVGTSTFKVATGFTLTNYNPVTKRITGGQILVIGPGRESGSFEVDGLDIENIDADITLDGVGANILDPLGGTNQSALRNANTIDNSGRLALAGGKSFLTAGNFVVSQDGRLEVGESSEFEVPAGQGFQFLNFDEISGEFNDGVFQTQGRIIAPNIRVRALNNTVTLDGNQPGAGFFRREGQELINGFNTLERIGTAMGNAGHLTLSGGYQLDLAPGPDHNLSLLGGSTLEIGTISSPGGRLHITEDVENPANPGGHFFQNGHLSIVGGQLIIDGDWTQGPGATSSITSVQPITAGGNFIQDGLGNFNGLVGVVGSFEVRGTLSGNATFQTGSGNFVLEDGVLRPGNSAGLMTIAGPAHMEIHGGILEMEIMGPVGGVGYDQLHILHQLLLVDPDPQNPLAKEVHVTLSNYLPAIGETFDLIVYEEGRLGDFSAVILPTIGAGRWFERMDTPTSLRLVVVPAPASALCLGGCGLLALRRRRRAV